jgi:hypothetical protein
MKQVKRTSKVNPSVVYETSNVAGYRYLTVYYGDKIMLQYTNKPVKSVTKLMAAIEKALPSMPNPENIRALPTDKGMDAWYGWTNSIKAE